MELENETNTTNSPITFIQQNRIIIYFVTTLVIAIIVLILLLRGLFTTTPTPPQDINSSPTPFEFGKQNGDNIELSPLQKTEIGRTTDEEIESNNKVISKSQRNGVTTYKVESKIPLTPDEIRTKNGIVIFERTGTKTNTAAPLQKLSDYEIKFGKPELVLDRVGPLGFENSAYLYPSKGFILYVNRYTQSVYEIQRFQPMTITEYKKQYGAEFLSPAPSPPAEGFQ